MGSVRLLRLIAAQHTTGLRALHLRLIESEVQLTACQIGLRHDDLDTLTEGKRAARMAPDETEVRTS